MTWCAFLVSVFLGRVSYPSREGYQGGPVLEVRRVHSSVGLEVLLDIFPGQRQRAARVRAQWVTVGIVA